jgi:hypothetical protein
MYFTRYLIAFFNLLINCKNFINYLLYYLIRSLINTLMKDTKDNEPPISKYLNPDWIQASKHGLASKIGISN